MRIAPRPLSTAIQELTATIAPATGAAISSAARPTAERDGILTVTCAAAVWAQELDLMAVDLVQSLNAALGEDAIRELRCRTG